MIFCREHFAIFKIKVFLIVLSGDKGSNLFERVVQLCGDLSPQVTPLPGRMCFAFAEQVLIVPLEDVTLPHLQLGEKGRGYGVRLNYITYTEVRKNLTVSPLRE